MKKKRCARVSNVLGTCLSQGKRWRNDTDGPAARKAADHSLALAFVSVAISLCLHSPALPTHSPDPSVSFPQPTHVLPLPPVALEEACPVTSQPPAMLSAGSMLSPVPRTSYPAPSRESVLISWGNAPPVRGGTLPHTELCHGTPAEGTQCAPKTSPCLLCANCSFPGGCWPH